MDLEERSHQRGKGDTPLYRDLARETSIPDVKQEITVPLRDVEIGEHIARCVQESINLSR